MIGSASATLMMSRAASLAHKQDGYTFAAALRDRGMIRSGYLTEESIHEVLGMDANTCPILCNVVLERPCSTCDVDAPVVSVDDER